MGEPQKLRFQGLSIHIEYPKGSLRPFQDDQGRTHRKRMHASYGEVRGTEGLDGDPVDVYVGPDAASDRVFVVTQMAKGDWKKVDEQKVILGVHTKEQARSLYLAHYDDPRFFGGVKEMGIDDFKKRLATQAAVGRKIASSSALIAEINYLRLQAGESVLVADQHGVKTAAPVYADLDEIGGFERPRSSKAEKARHAARLATSNVGIGAGTAAGTAYALRNAPPAARAAAAALAGYGGMRAAKDVRSAAPRAREAWNMLRGGMTDEVPAASRFGGAQYGEKVSAYEPWSPAIERAKEAQRKFAAEGDPDPQWDNDLDNDVKRKLQKQAPQRLEDMRRSAIGETDVVKQEQRGLGISDGNAADNPKDSKMRKAAALARVQAFSSRAKTALSERGSRIADRVDDVGIGILASPYIAGGIAKRIAGKPGTLGRVGAGLQAYHDAFPSKHRKELAGLALVAPGVTHTVAKGIDKGIDKVAPGKAPAGKTGLASVTTEAAGAAVNIGKKVLGKLTPTAMRTAGNAATTGVRNVGARGRQLLDATAGRGQLRLPANAGVSSGTARARAMARSSEAQQVARGSNAVDHLGTVAPPQTAPHITPNPAAPGTQLARPAPQAPRPSQATVTPGASPAAEVMGSATPRPQRVHANPAAEPIKAQAVQAPAAVSGTTPTVPGAAPTTTTPVPSPAATPVSTPPSNTAVPTRGQTFADRMRRPTPPEPALTQAPAAPAPAPTTPAPTTAPVAPAAPPNLEQLKKDFPHLSDAQLQAMSGARVQTPLTLDQLRTQYPTLPAAQLQAMQQAGVTAAQPAAQPGMLARGARTARNVALTGLGVTGLGVGLAGLGLSRALNPGEGHTYAPPGFGPNPM